MAENETQTSAENNSAAETQTVGTQTDSNVTESQNNVSSENSSDSKTAEEKVESQTEKTDAEKTETDEGEKGLGENPEELFAKEYIGKPEDGYDYKEVLPEGMELNKDLTEKFNDIAGKYNMANKGANEVMALAVDLAKQTQDGVLNAQFQAIEANKIKYIEAVKNDPEIGGAKFDENLRVANLAYSKFIQSDAEAHNIFDKTGLGCHPAVIKMFYEVGMQMQNDTVHREGQSVSAARSAEAKLYSSTTPSQKGGSVKAE